MTAKKTVASFYRAVADGDLPAMLGLLADDVEWTEADGFPYAGTYRGTRAVLDGVFHRVSSEWTEFRTEPDLLVAEGDEVMCLGTYRGSHRASGKGFSARFVHAVTVRDGRIARFEQVVDSVPVVAAMA